MKKLLLLTAFILTTHSVWAQTTLNKNGEIQKAAETGNYQKFSQLIKNKKINLNFQDHDGMTLLMSATLGGNIKIVKTLLRKNVALESKNKVGDTALAVAIGNDHFEAAREIIKAGANVDVFVAGETNDTLLTRSAYGDLETTKLILKKNPSLVNKANNKGETALMKSIEFGYNDIAKLLLTNGADPALKTKDGKTALDIAKESNNKEAIKILSAKK